MMIPCSQCSKICWPDDFYEIDYSVEEFSAFCSKECKANWDSRVSPEYDSDCTCEGCKRTLGQGKTPVEFWYYTAPYYFCGQMCRDKWLLGISDNL
jgi:YHS domain-containing protein